MLGKRWHGKWTQRRWFGEWRHSWVGGQAEKDVHEFLATENLPKYQNSI